MTMYAALLYYPPDRYWLSPAEAHTTSGYPQFFGAATAAGVLRAGEALYPPQTACTVTVSGDAGGDVQIKDGPHLQTADVLGGFYVIEAADISEAAGWAAQIPAAWRGAVELRPIVPMENKPGQ